KLPVPEVQVPWDGVVVPRVKPLGQVSVRLTPVASEGPAFVTVIVYARESPFITAVTPSVLVTDKSALVATVSVSLAELLPGVGSEVLLLTITLLVCDPAGVVDGT